MNCTHEMWEICAAVPDGICPICQQVELKQLRKAHDVIKSDCAECFAQNESLRALNAELREGLEVARICLKNRDRSELEEKAYFGVCALLAKSEAAE